VILLAVAGGVVTLDDRQVSGLSVDVLEVGGLSSPEWNDDSPTG